MRSLPWASLPFEAQFFLHSRKVEKTARRSGKATRQARVNPSAKFKDPEDKAGRVLTHNSRQAEQSLKAKTTHATTTAKAHELLLINLEQPKYRALFVAVARLFSHQLIADYEVLRKIESLPASADKTELFKQISLAGKWAPTPGHSHDSKTNISTAISLLLYDAQVLQAQPAPAYHDQPLSIQDAQRLRTYYQRWVLTPLRRASLIPESLMSSNHWNEIRYTRVSSVCMKNNTEKFAIHDEERFEKYLTAVEKGKKKISGATLMPHELVAQALVLGKGGSDPVDDKASPKNKLKQLKKKIADSQIRVVEAQWKALVQSLREHGTLSNALAVCDVSGSMGDIYSQLDKKDVRPIFPAVSLSLVLAQLAQPPFDNGFITFSESPRYVQLDPSKGLVQTVAYMVGSNWGMNTDLEAVFLKLILPLAVKNSIKQEDMIKKIFIFSDMQFDDGCKTSADPADWNR